MKIFYKNLICLSIILLIWFFSFKKLNSEEVDKSIPALIYNKYNWSFLSYYDEADKRICYLFSRKVDSFSNDKRERDAYINIVFFGKLVQVSINLGYEIKTNSTVAVNLDKKVYIFRAYEGSVSVILEKDEYDYSFLKDLKKVKKISVFSQSNQHTYAVDIYSFRGFSENYDKLIQECKIDYIGL